jgi:uncharacterized membrane protein YdjX (TVP38/TMEM64 family)
MSKSTLVRVALGGLVIGAVFVGVRRLLAGYDVEPALEQVRDLGPWGLVLLAVAYTPASLVLFPGSILTLAAGYFYGLVPAFVAISLGSTAATAVVFLVGRTVARGWVEARLAHHPVFRALDQAVGEQGFKIVLLTRLSPLFPFTLLNYAFSLTRVSFRSYVLASWIGMWPGTLLYVYLGTSLESVTEILTGSGRPRPPGETYFKWAGLLATLIATVLIARIARQALVRNLSAAEGPRQNPDATAVRQGTEPGVPHV